MSNLNVSIGPERVQVFDQPIGNVQVAGASTSVTAFLISTAFGGAPVNTPTSVSTFADFTTLFGLADDIADDGYYAVEGYYNNAGDGAVAIIVNVGTSPTAASYIGNASAGTGLRALDPIDNVGLVCIPGLPLSMAYLTDSSLVDYSKTVRADFGATLSTCFSVLSIPKEISKANTDVLMVTTAIDTGGITGLVVSLSGTPNLSAVTPGMIVKKAGVFKAVITAVDNSLKTITLTTVSGLAALDAITINMPSAITYKDLVINVPSRVAGWYFNNPLVLDESTSASPGDLVTVAPVGHVCGIMARIDSNTSIGGVSHAPAGLQYAGMAGIKGLSLSLSERLDAAPLRLAFINRITSFPGSGNIVFGAYTAGGSTVTADEQLIQVMRALQFIKASLEPGLRGFLWENFSPVTQARIRNAVESFMRNNIYLFPQGLAENEQFKVISVTPTQDELDEGLLRVRVQVKPNKAVRFIEVTLEYPLPEA